MNVSNFSISTRLVSGFALVLSINAAAMLYAIATIGGMSAEFRQLTSDSLKQVRAVEDWAALTAQNAPRSLALAVSADPQLAELLGPQVTATSKQITDLQKQVEGHLDSAQARALFAKVSEKRKNYMAEREKVFALKSAGKQAEAAALASSAMAARLDEYRAATATLRDEARGRIDAAAQAMAGAAEKIRGWLLGFLGASLVLSLVIALVLTRGITRPLRSLMGIADRVAKGDLRSQIVSSGKDEIGALVRSVGLMQDNLRTLISTVRADVEAVSRSSNQLAAAADELAAGAESQTEAVASTASSVQELTASIAQVSENAQVARSVVEQTSEVSGLGLAQGGAAEREIGAVDRSIGEFSSQMEQLTAHAAEIGSVVKLIKAIADQTNLLALNAAIEAARAGEQGRGFAVVADEVRKLAERTTGATDEIQSTIESIQSSVAGTGARIDALKISAGAGVQCIQGLMQPLGELRSRAEQAAESLRDLSEATREQRLASEQIAHTTERIAASAEQNRSAVGQSRDTAAGLKDLAARLTSSVNLFQL
jgi:methyl-accepting chemotaxis protein